MSSCWAGICAVGSCDRYHGSALSWSLGEDRVGYQSGLQRWNSGFVGRVIWVGLTGQVYPNFSMDMFLRRVRAMGYAHPTLLISTFRMHNRAQSTLHFVPMTGIFLTCTSYLTAEPIVYSSAWCEDGVSHSIKSESEGRGRFLIMIIEYIFIVMFAWACKVRNGATSPS